MGFVDDELSWLRDLEQLAQRIHNTHPTGLTGELKREISQRIIKLLEIKVDNHHQHELS